MSIGSKTVIGAGSVVTKDVPEGVFAAGNPCRIIREVTEQDHDRPAPDNLFTDLPATLPEELVEVLAESSHVRIERIVSTGQASPTGFWYDQGQHEWVVILKGRAKLLFEGVTSKRAAPARRRRSAADSAGCPLSKRLPQRRLPVRLLGMGVSGIDRSQFSQRTLFETGRQQQAQLDAVADSIQERFGAGALRRGSSLRK